MSENLAEQLAVLPAYFQGHLTLTLAALGLGIAVSVPLGALAVRSRALKRPLLAAVSIIQTFPSVAILALVVAMLGGRIGLLPALVALVLYSMLPIARNTVAGLESVPAEVTEAARGIGMSPTQILLHVRLPLALPVIVAGIRTAAVWTVGLATLSTLVGATSFGNYIFTGLQTRNLTAVTVGSLAAALMAVAIDALIGGVQWLSESRARGAPPRRIRRVRMAVAGGLAAGALLSVLSLLPEPEPDFVVGAKGFTEQHIMAGLLAAELEAAGFTVARRLGLGTEMIYEATSSGAVDVYLEYSGTVWANILRREDNPGRERVLEEVERHIAANDNMRSAARLGFQNLYAFAMRRDRAAELGVRTVADLAAVAGGLRAGGDLEFFARPEWRRVRDGYGFDFGEKLTFDTTLMYTAVAEGQVDVISAYTTDGRVAHYDLLLLEDPLGALPPYDAFLAASARAMADPGFAAAMGALAGRIPDEAMRQANRIVDVDGGTVAQAVDYLRRKVRGAD